MNLFKKVKGVVPFSALLAASIFWAVFFLCTNFWLPTVYAGGTEGYAEPAESYINPLWSYDGNFLLLSDNNSDGVYIYNIDDSSLVQITDAPSSGYKYNWSFNTREIGFKLLIKTDEDLFKQVPVIFDLKNNEMVALHEAVDKAGVPSFSADGKIAFTINDQLFILTHDRTIKERIDLGHYANLTPLSPDGTKVVYNDANDQMWLIDSNGSNKKKLTSNEYGYFNPIWSPDSSKICISTLSGELKVIDIATGKVFYLDKGNNPSWSPDSKYVLYSKVESVAGYKITSADIYLIKYDGSQKIPLTTTKDELEGYANWSPDGRKIVFGSYMSGDLFWVPLHTPANTIKALEGVSLPQLGTVEKIQYDSLKKWEGKIPSTEKKTKNNLPDYLALSTSSISNVPYIHQVYDTPNEFNGYWACNASSALMAITYYGILPYWDCTVSIPYSHTSHYGRYVSDIYTYNGYTYNTGSLDASCNRTAYGGYGYITQDAHWCTNPQAGTTAPHLRDYLQNHGLTSDIDWSISWSELQNEINNGYPLVLLTDLTNGHYILGIGYISEQHTVIVNDPYGDKNQGYMNYNGASVSYDWPGYNNGHSNLNTVHCFIYAEYPDSPENIGLTQGIWVYENDPSSYPVEYGQWLDAQFTVKNYGSQAVTFSKIGIGGRAPSSNGGNPDPNNVYDLGFDNNITLQPNEQRDFFYDTNSFGKNNIWGSYKLTAVYQLPDGTWHEIPPGEPGTGTSHEFQVVQHSSPSSLSNGIGKSDYVPRKGYDHFYIDLPSNASNLVIKTTEARNGDYIDLYEKAGSSYPTTSSYGHSAYTSSSNETITISNPSSGRHCILVYGYYSSGSEKGTPYKITATYEINLPPSAPTNVQASDGTYTDKVRITWSASSGATSYEVYRATSSGGTKSQIGTPSGTSYDDTSASIGTTYYYWVKAKNTYGTSGYSSYNTGYVKGSALPPTVTTTAVSSITSNSASSGGNVTSNGGASVTARGVCWSTSANPTTSDSHTSDGTGTGSFTSSITGLSPNTTYHVRAYATNSEGTGYGSDQTFTTKGEGGKAMPWLQLLLLDD